MSLNVTEARDEILALFRTAAEANASGVPVLYWDAPDDDDEPQDGTDRWMRVTVRHTTGNNDAIGNTLFQREGTVTVQIFGILGNGLSIVDELSKVCLDAFQGKSTPGGVWFRNVRLNEIGHDGDWFQSNVLADFEYTERL